MKEEFDYSLLKHNTFGIDARCRHFVEIETAEEATTVLPRIASEPFIIIGGGSNLLLTQNYPGTVVRSAIRGISASEFGDDVFVHCGSGEVVDDVIAYCIENGYYGAENLSLIPGEVGASVVQNVGAYGSEIKDIVAHIQAVDIQTGEKVEIEPEACEYAYRQSRFKKEWKNRYIVTYVTYRLSKTFVPRLDYGNIRQALDEKRITEPTAKQLRDTIIEIRQSKLPDPKVLGNAGSFFMNPIVSREKFESLLAQYPQMPHYHIDEEHEKIPAGWMIDQCGWKGRSLGKAGVHEKQALVLVNKGGASGGDIVALCETIQKDVYDRFGIEINPEVNVI